VWSADHETADLSQWTVNGTRGGSYDSGICIRPPSGVTSELAHSGLYSMKMTSDTSAMESGCRQFRHEESTTGNPYFYSVWLYFPQHVMVQNYWNVVQFKSESPTRNDAMWVLDVRNRPNGAMYFTLRWKGTVPGPTASDGTMLKLFQQELNDIPVGQWFHVEVYLRQSSAFDGQISVWQDGTQIFSFDQIKTKYPDGDNRWSVNNYSDGLTPSIVTLYVDDAAVSTTRLGP